MAALGTGDTLVERYELLEVIGRGRSEVYRARDARLGRDVAIKKVELVPGPVSPDADDVRARALREARAAASIASPSVVAVYDLVEADSAVWLVMELVRAPSLTELVSERGPLDDEIAAAVGLGVLDALTAAHARGIVHRDVKPSNVLVDLADDGPGTTVASVKLADFGVAALRDETSQTSPGSVIGSPSYMSPEQASARPVGPPADLWGLGATLYFAVEGEPPFLADSAIATATAVVHGEPRPPQRPSELARVIEMLLEKDPARRPDAARVQAILRPIAGGPEPVATGAHPVPAAATGDDTLTGRPAPAGPAPTGPLDRLRRLGVPPAAMLVAAVLLAAVALAVFNLGPDESPDAEADSGPATTTTSTATTVVDDGDGGGVADGWGDDRPRPREPRAETTVPPSTATTSGDRAGSTTTEVPDDTTTTSAPAATTTTTAPDDTTTTSEPSATSSTVADPPGEQT